MPKLKPVVALVPNAAALLELAERAYADARAAPSDPLPTLTCFLLTYHLTDWTKEAAAFSASCPFAQTIREVANGTKHLELTPKRTPDPHVDTVEAVQGYGRGRYGVGPYGRAYIAVQTRASSSEQERPFSAVRILREALDWWATVVPAEEDKKSRGMDAHGEDAALAD